MDLNALHVFYWAAKLGGIGAAARKLDVTQPAVSQRLRSLEARRGKKLYGRAGNKFVLTEDGQRLLDACRPSFEALDLLEPSLAGAPTQLQGTIRIVSLSEFAKAFLLPRFKEFIDRHPGVRFQMEYRHPYEMLPLLLRHETDFVFTNESYDKPQLESVHLFTEKYVFVGRGPKRRFAWKDLQEVPWLSCRSEDYYWFEFKRMMSARGLAVPAPAIEIADIDSLLMQAAAGAGCALVPLHAVELRPSSKLAIHDVPFRPIRQKIHASRLKTVALGEAARLFWDGLTARRR